MLRRFKLLKKTLEEMLQPGNKVKVFISKENIHNQLRHIRAIIDNEYIVYKVWFKSKQDWRYFIEHVYKFELEYKQGWLS